MSIPSSTLAGSSPNAPGQESAPVNGHPGPSQVNGTGHVVNGDTPAPDPSQALATRRDEEAARKDRSLGDFLLMLDGYKPMVSYALHIDVGSSHQADTRGSHRVLPSASRI
jgi:transcription initiation factor TFIID subunit 10